MSKNVCSEQRLHENRCFGVKEQHFLVRYCRLTKKPFDFLLKTSGKRSCQFHVRRLKVGNIVFSLGYLLLLSKHEYVNFVSQNRYFKYFNYHRSCGVNLAEKLNCHLKPEYWIVSERFVENYSTQNWTFLKVVVKKYKIRIFYYTVRFIVLIHKRYDV